MVVQGPTRSLPGWPIPFLGGLVLVTVAWLSFPSAEDWEVVQWKRLPWVWLGGWFVLVWKFRRIGTHFRRWDAATPSHRMRLSWMGLQGWGGGGLPGTGPETVLWPLWHFAYHRLPCPPGLGGWMAIEWLGGVLFGLFWWFLVQGSVPLGWLGGHVLLVLALVGGLVPRVQEDRSFRMREVLGHLLSQWLELLVLGGLTFGVAGGEAPSALAWTMSLGWALPAWFWNWSRWDWQRKTVPSSLSPSDLQVLIPTLNEVEALPHLWRDLEPARRAGVQVLVVDGGSTDGTLEWAKANGLKVLSAPRGRGAQLEAGWTHARSNAYWFLHADCRVDHEGYQRVLEALRDPWVIGGGGWKRFDGFHPALLGSRVRCWLRLKLWGWILGDQGFFIRRECLEKTGGWMDWPVMEDVAMSESAGRQGELILADYRITTSMRRFERHGIVGTYRIMWRLVRDYRRGQYPVDQWSLQYPEGSRGWKSTA